VKYFSKRMVAVFSLIVFAVLPHLLAAQENSVYAPTGLPTVSWTELIFKGSKFMTRITVKIRMSSADQSDDLSVKSEDGLGDCSETVTAQNLLTVQSSSKGLGSSQSKYEEKIWFNETAVDPERRVRLSGGDAPWVKSYCWEDKGVRRQKILPGNSSEKKQSPAKWTKRSRSFYEYPAEVTGCDTISDPSLVFYMLSTLDFDREQKNFNVCVFGKKQLHRLSIGQEPAASLQVSYKNRSFTKDATVDEKIKPVVLTITSENFAPDNGKPETYSFLGLNKDIRIYMDAEKRLPVRISGTNNSIGALTLDLSSKL
jgi:hypothetical protein